MEALGRGRVGTRLHELSYCIIDQAGCTAHSLGPHHIQVISFLLLPSWPNISSERKTILQTFSTYNFLALDSGDDSMMATSERGT